MYLTIFPEKDATIYSQYPTKNTGVDQILEISKKTFGAPSLTENDESVYYGQTYNSRILIKFDLSSIPSGVNFESYLTLKATSAEQLPTNYSLYAFPISSSWENGTGYYSNTPEISNGTSWKYKSSKLTGTEWLTSSFNSGTTGSFNSVPGGGTWFTASVCSQSFSFSEPDVRMNVTSIVNQWLSGSIQNNGFVLKLSDVVEQDSTILSTIQFFSKETHTIFIPRLEVFWDNSDLSGISGFAEINTDDFIVNAKNIRETYSDVEKPKVRFAIRELFPQQTYATSSNYIGTQNRLPTSSYFQIQDVVTDDIIIPFNTIGTKVNCDSNGNYIKLDCTSLLPERYYKVVLKSEFDGGETIRLIDDNFVFKIRRN